MSKQRHLPKIFISHSAHNEVDKQFMNTLVNRLENAGYKLYCDQKRLKVGSHWRNELYTAIGCCNAAIILITKEALDVLAHPWVFHECSMLTIINWADKDFPIFPITMNGVTISDIEKSPFGALRISDKQIVSFNNIDEIIEKITTQLCDLSCSEENEPLFYHYKRIGSRLAAVNSQLIKNAIEQVDSELTRWDPMNRELQYNLAILLLSLTSSEIIDVLQEILPSLGESDTKKLLYFIAPFWLDLPTVASLENMLQIDQLEIQKKSGSKNQNYQKLRKAFCLNASRQDTGRMHASRAGFLRKQPYRVIDFPYNDAGTDDENRYASHIIARMRTSLLDSDAIVEEFAIKYALDHPTFIIIPYGVDKDIILNLRKRFWSFIFMVLIGNDDPTDWSDSQFMILEPLLESGKEDKVYYQLNEAINLATTIINGY